MPIPLGDAFTLASWVYLPSGENSIRTIAANSASGFNTNGFRFFINRFNAANAELVLETGNGSQSTLIVSPAGTVATDRWQHVAAVVDRSSGQATLYLNASPVASGAVRTDFNNNTQLAVGAMIPGIHGLRGNIDDFRIYSHLLTTGEINSVFAAFNESPLITPPAALTMAAGTTSAPLAFAVDDEESGPENLVLTAITSDPALLPSENIILAGSGAVRTITITPVAWKAGVVTVTLTASDGLAASETGFQVTVTNDGHSALWTATTPGAPLAWSTPGNWSLAIPPFPGAACDLDFLSGSVVPSGTIIASQDLAAPFTARSLRLGGSGGGSLRILGSPLSLVVNGPGTPSITLDSTAAMTHEIETSIQIAANCAVSGNGDATFVFKSEISGTGGLIKTGLSSLTLSGANTFNGSVNIQSGVVRAAHDSALGSSGTGTTVQGGTALAALELTGGITTAEPIQLVMQNTAGHTQLRNVSGNNTLTGQLSLNAGGARWDIESSAGSLHVAGPVTNIANPANPDTWRKLHLGGNAGGIFSGSMTDAAKSKFNVAVNSGTWTLTGSAKSYTGTTEVIGGSLVVDVSLQSPVIVSAGAVLRGQGGSTTSTLELENDAVIAIAPQSWGSPPAPFTAAQLQVARAVIRIDAPQPAGFTETPRSLPLIHVPAGIGAPDLSLLTIEATGLPGTGRWSVVTHANTLSLNYQPDLYQAWVSGIDWNGADSAPGADPDADDINNFLEYALNGNPLQADRSALPSVDYTGGRLVLAFRRIADPDLLYEVLASTGLTNQPGDWQVVWSSTGVSNIPGPVVVEDTPPAPTPERRFLRLRVTRIPLSEVP
jgi:autotransporter-associated beta strand protein